MADGIKIGGAYYEISADSAPLVAEWAKAEAASKKSAQVVAQATGLPEKAVARYAAAMIREQKAAADAAEKSAQRIAAASAKASGGLGDLAKGAAGFAAAAAGVTLGAAAVGAAMSKIAEETQKAAQAQFAFAATFKATAGAYTQFVDQQAAATRRTTTEVKESIVAFGSLSNRYAVDSEQIKELTKRSADLAAVKGITTVEAAKRLEGAIRGEAEAAEFLGLTLNSDYMKKFADMTAEQRRNWEMLDPLIKAQITYREALKQSADVQGTAAKRTQEGAGAWDNANTAVSNLALTIGKELNPAWAATARGIEAATKALDDYLKKEEERGKRRAAAQNKEADAWADSIPSWMLPDSMHAAIEAHRREISDSRDVDSGRHEGADVAVAAADARKARDRAAAERRDNVKSQLAEAKEALDKQVELELDAIDAEKKTKAVWYDEEKTRIEARRYYQLHDIETRRDATLKGIEQERQAAKDALDDQIERAGYAKDAEIKEAERKKEASIVQIDAESDAAKDLYDGLIHDAERARDGEIKEAERKRDAAVAAIEQEKQALADARRSDDRERSDSRRADDRELAAGRKREDQSRDDSKAARIKATEEEHERTVDAIDRQIAREQDRKEKSLRGIEEEADARRDANDAAMRAIDQQRQAESDRHRKVLSDLDAEEAERLAAIDKQLAALDQADQTDQYASKDQQLADAVTNAKLGVKRAESTGNYSEILKAQQELADAEDAIRQEGVDRERDAERAKLKAAQDAIKAEIAAKKDAEDEVARVNDRAFDLQEQQLNDALDAQLRVLDQRKRAVNDETDNALAKLAKRKDAESDDYRDTVDRINRRYELGKRKLDQQRTDEDQALADRRESEDRDTADRRTREDREMDGRLKAVQQELETERESIKEHYDGEGGVIPTYKKASEGIAKEHQVRREAAERELKNERDAIAAHYDGEDGVITLLKKKSEEIGREYTARREAAEKAFDEERKAAALIYTNPEKTGLLDLLDKARTDEFNKLEQSKIDWQAWQTKVQGNITAAQKDLDAFITSIGNLDAVGGVVKIDGQDQPPKRGGGGDPGGDAAYSPVVRNASSDSYWTSGGTHGGHPAADIFAAKGEPIYAPIGGRVSPSTYPLGGNTAMLDGDDGRSYYFAHGNVPFEGGKVRKGQQIGEVGDTGNARGTSPHLHFAISSQGSSLFGDLNGSGDVSGDESWWKSGAPMAGGDGGRDSDADYDKIITILGRQFGLRGLGSAESYEEMVRLLRPVAKKFGISAEVMAAIAGNEAGYGDERSRLAKKWHNWFGVKGEGDAGQTPPLWTWEDDNGNGQEDPGEQVQSRFAAYSSDRAAFEVWARQFSTGRYARAKEKYQETGDPVDYLKGLYRAGYATDADWVDQVRSIGKFRHGGMIREPTLLVGARSGPYAFAGEAGPERVMSPESSRAYDAANGGNGGTTYLDFRGANIYDGHKFKDRVVEALRDAKFSGQVRKDIFG